MTAEEWETCKDASSMMQQLDWKQYDRKLRLFAVACCRRVPALADDASAQEVINLAEQFADQLASYDQLLASVEHLTKSPSSFLNQAVANAAAVRCASYRASAECYFRASSDAVAEQVGTRYVSGADHELKGKEFRARVGQCGLLREIVGNPFRPVAFDPAWRTANTVGVARHIYDNRAFHDLPILADALEEAGCDNADVLRHCREPGEHVRGCWVVDLVLDKS